VSKLFEFDRGLSLACGGNIAGMDEAGRGPLAGPVVCAAAVMPMDFEIEGIDDSKALSPKVREKLYAEITAAALCYTVSVIDSDVIDSINILQATKLGMQRCAEGLTVRPRRLIIDALDVACGIETLPLTKADATSYNVAAASIIAKVTRDRLMEEFDEEFPGYLFAKHKGYGTREHIELLTRRGACPIHRRTFIKNFITPPSD